MSKRFATFTRRSLGLLLALLFLAPIASAQEPLTFGVIGDSGVVSPGLLGVARNLTEYHDKRQSFDFVLMLGDNVYEDGVGPGLKVVFEDPFARLLKEGVQFYAVLGNHDIRRGTELQINYDKWNMRGRHYYSFTKGDGLVEFFALDSTALSNEARRLVDSERARLERQRATLERKQQLTGADQKKLARLNAELGEDRAFLKEQDTLDDEQITWLRDGLKNSQARWKVVFLHHSIYSTATKLGGHGGQASVKRLRALLEPIFVEGKVNVVFAGHDHHYDRSTPQPAVSPNGHRVVYFTEGSSAKLRRGLASWKNTFCAAFNEKVNTFLVVTATKDVMKVKAIDSGGKHIDSIDVPYQP